MKCGRKTKPKQLNPFLLLLICLSRFLTALLVWLAVAIRAHLNLFKKRKKNCNTRSQITEENSMDLAKKKCICVILNAFGTFKLYLSVLDFKAKIKK